MDEALAAVTRAVTWASNLVWGPWTIALLLGTGLYLTLRYRFIQLRRLPEALRRFMGGRATIGRALARKG